MRKLLLTIASLILVSIYSFGQVMNNEYVTKKSNQVFDSLHIKAKAIITVGSNGKRGIIIGMGIDQRYNNDTLALSIYSSIVADSVQLYDCINIVPNEPNRAPKFITYLVNNPLFLATNKKY